MLSSKKRKDIRPQLDKRRLSIQKVSDPTLLGISRFTNARASGSCYCHLEYAYGGYTNFVLSSPGDYAEYNIRDASPYDSFCWSSDYTPDRCNAGSEVESGYDYKLVD
jgi:hypothetical protein